MENKLCCTNMSFNLYKDLKFLILQYFQEANLKEAARTFGRESGLYFDLKYFEELVLEGKWDEAEKYLSGFIRIYDDNYSIKMYFEIRKQKYFEALDNKDRHKARDILLKDLKVFAHRNEAVVKDLSYFLTVDNIREVKPTYKDACSARRDLMIEIKEILNEHPLLREKLKFPVIESQRLPHLLDESIKWQQQQNSDKELDLLTDHGSNSGLSTFALTNSASQLLRNFIRAPSSGCNLSSLGKAMEWRASTSGRSRMNSDEIVKLAYNNAGNSILALASNGIHLVWLWPLTTLNFDGKATARVSAKFWQPKDAPQFMVNDLPILRRGNPVSTFDISKMDGYIISTSGGMVTLFNMVTFKTLRTFWSPPPMATCVVFYPKDNNIFGVGVDDSTILIYHVRDEKVLQKLEGHSKRVTALAFSNSSDVLISADSNGLIILWNTNRWDKFKDKQLQIHGNQVPESETQIQFHPDQIHFLVAHISHLAIYETTELRCVNQWIPESPLLMITQAAFSCDGHTVYSILVDGTVAIFYAPNLQIRCRIYPSTYLSPISRLGIFPISVAAHPQKPSQFVVGLSDGSAYVFEPREPGATWIKAIETPN
ncbi:hypothetical protein VNO78_29170 [Psophocarpus tetragonolobus]|uniref:CTLH domain-containing protein n=1 Tax=Psophocarpus tetragonolobus TaxID=3891 RepID=A0AAN9X2W7_PSOTE